MKRLSLRPTIKFFGIPSFQKPSVHYFGSFKAHTNIYGHNGNIFNPLQSILQIQTRLITTPRSRPSTNKGKPMGNKGKPAFRRPSEDIDEEEDSPKKPAKIVRKQDENTIKLRKNYEINSFEVRVIGPDGPVGIMKIGDAIKLAQQHKLDLVEVGPNAKPPVCRIISFQKMEFDAKKASKSTSVKHKEMIFTIAIAQHDFDTKTRKVREMLEKSHHVTLTINLPKPVLTAEMLRERALNKNKKTKKEEEEEFRLPPELVQSGIDMATKIAQALEPVGKPTKQPTVEHLQYKVIFDVVPVGKKAQQEAQKKAAQSGLQKPQASSQDKGQQTPQGQQKEQQN